MSSLYRCKVRVAYKPNGLDKLIVFEERQIAEAEVNLKWENDAATSNTESVASNASFASSLSSSTCRVTINDPYLTGLAWPALYDAASMYNSQTSAAKSGILLRDCEPGEDPLRNKCKKLPDIDSTNQPYQAGLDQYPHLLVSMWYDVKGVRFGTDFYFRVVNISITHGTQYPSVQLLGQESRAIIFNQSLQNYSFPEGTTFEKAIEKIVKNEGYTPNFCFTDYSKYSLVQPSATRVKGSTPYEAVKRYLNASGGNLLTMPTREWKDKVSICTRNEVNQGCKVFYLGVGLYEGYTMDGVPNAGYAANLEGNITSGSILNSNSNYSFPIFEADEYRLDGESFKNLRKEKLKNVKNNQFKGLFDPLDKRFEPGQATTAYYWGLNRVPLPRVVNELATSIQLHAVSPNGPESIAYLDGLLRVADPQKGEVVILTKYFIRGCGKIKGTTNSKCFSSPIWQRITGLSEVLVKTQPDTKVFVTMNQVVGKSTKENPDQVSFFLRAEHLNGALIYIPPSVIARYAIPEEGLTDEEKNRFIGQQQSVTVNSSGDRITSVRGGGLSDPARNPVPAATTTSNAQKILIMSGHADITSSAPDEVIANNYALDWVQRNSNRFGISNLLEYYRPPSGNIQNEGDPNSQFSVTSRYVAQGYHVIELHHDAPNGKSGVIFPYSGKTIRPLDTQLSVAYGSFGPNFRDDRPTGGKGLGVPVRGGMILELAALDARNKARALSSNPQVREDYYAQALTPLMETIRSLYSVNGQVATPAPGGTNSSTASSPPLQVGLLGSTGNSSAPHLHAEWMCDGRRCSRPQLITVEDVDKYVRINGRKPSEVGVSNAFLAARPGGRVHYGIDFDDGKVYRTPITIIGGAIAESAETGCTVENDRFNPCKDGNGYGNNVIIRTPEGRQMILAHLYPGSVNPEQITGRSGGGDGAGSFSGGNGGKSDSGIMSGPTANGLHISTSFKGVPRALRIIPGRTILSFVTEYDKWLEQDKDKKRSIDPGVWIPDRFSNFFMTDLTLAWKGDLRVTTRGVIDWGFTRPKNPSFKTYLEGMQKSNSSTMKNYFDYIRSLGDLCYIVGGKNSCETECTEIQAISSFLKPRQEQTGSTTTPGQTNPPPQVSTSYPPSKCRYNGSKYASKTDTINQIINALASVGVTSRAGYAGVIGNAIDESTLDPFIHNPAGGRENGCDGRRSGCGCSLGATENGRYYPPSSGYGLFQWCYSRQEKIISKCGRKSEGRSGNLQCQLSHTIEELRGNYAPVIARLNSATTAEQGAIAWVQVYEGALTSTYPRRVQYANEVFNDIVCSP